MNVKRKASVITLVVLTVMSLAAFSLGVFGLSEPSAKAEETSEVSATVTVENESGAVSPNATHDGVNYYLSGAEGNKLKITFGEFSADEKAVVTYGGSTFTANSANATVTADFVGGVLEIAYYNGETLVKTEKNANNVLLKGVEGFSSSEATLSGLYYALGGKWAETTVTTDGSEVSCFGSTVGEEADFDLYAFGYYGALGVKAAVLGGTGENIKVFLNGEENTELSKDLKNSFANNKVDENGGIIIENWTTAAYVHLSNEEFNRITFRMTATEKSARAFIKNYFVPVPGINPEEIAPATLKIGDSEDLVTVTKNGTVACDFVGKSVTITAPDNKQSYIEEGNVESTEYSTTLYVNGNLSDAWTFDSLEDGTKITIKYSDSLIFYYATLDFDFYEAEILYEYTFTLKTPGTVVTVGGKTLSEAALIEKDGVYYILNEDGAENNVKVSFIGTLSETTSARIYYGAKNTKIDVNYTGVETTAVIDDYNGETLKIEYRKDGTLVSTESYNIIMIKPFGIDGVYYANDGTYPWEFVNDENGSYMQSYVTPGTTQFGVDSGKSTISLYVTGYSKLTFEATQSSENNWDYLLIYKNADQFDNFQIYNHQETSFSELVWKQETMTFDDSVLTIAKFQYLKDSYANSNVGLDRAFLRNFKAYKSIDVSAATFEVSSSVDGIAKTYDIKKGLAEANVGGEINFNISDLGINETVTVVNGENSTVLTKANGYHTGKLTGLTENTELKVVISADGYLDYELSFNLTVKATIQGDLVQFGGEYLTIDNTQYTEKIDYGEEYPFEKSNTLVNGISGNESYPVWSNPSQNTELDEEISGLVFKITKSGLLTFDYYINSSAAYSGGGTYGAAKWSVKKISCGQIMSSDGGYLVENTNISKPVQIADAMAWRAFYQQGYQKAGGTSDKSEVGWLQFRSAVSVNEGEILELHLAIDMDFTASAQLAISNVRFLSGVGPFEYSSNDGNKGTVTATANGEAVSSGDMLAFGTEVTLTATPKDGYKFYGWTDNSGNAFFTEEIKITMQEGADYTAIFAKDGEYSARIGGTFYETFDNALSACHGGETIFLLKDFILTIDLTIPDGVTVILPYAADDTTGYKEGGTHTRVSWNDGVLPYVTFTVNNGVTLTVNGKLIVGGVQHHTSQSAQAHTSGDYAKIVNNGSLIVNGNMDVRGLVDGAGTLTVNSGAELKQPFMVNDYAGGSNTACLYYNAKQFPFNQFSTINVQCKQIINYGAKVVGSTSLFTGTSTINTQEVILVWNKEAANKEGSTDGSLIWMEEGSRLEITYKNKTINQTVGNIHLGDSGVCTIAVYGNITAGEFKLQSYGSTGKVLAIPYTYNFELKSGSKVTLAQKYKIMPGAKVVVEQGAELNITADGELYVYDGLIQSDKSGKLYPDASVLGKYGFDKSGMLVVNGKLTIDGAFAGIVQTSGNGEIVVSSGAAVGEQEITEGCDHTTGWFYKCYTTNKTVFRMTGRIYGLYGFVNLQAGKTYKANGNEQFTLENFTVDSASRITELTVTLNQPMTGRFFEFDGEKFVSEVEFSVDLEDGATVYINGTAYTVGGGKITATLTFGEDRKFSYYTGGKETSLAAHEGEIQADTATVLGYAVKSVELSETNVYEIAEGETFALKAVITYADGTEEVALTAPSFTTYVLKNASLTSEKLAVSFTRDLTVVKTALTDYITSVEALDDLPGDNLVEAAKNCYAAYGALIKGLNADDLAFVNGKIGDKQAYASEIAKEFSAEDYCFTYGDDGAPVTLTMVDGSTKPGVAGIAACAPGNQVVTATIVYRGYFKEKYYDLHFNRDILVNPLEISVKWAVGSYVYDGTERKPEATLSGVLAGDAGEVAVIVKGAINAGEHTAVATLTGDKAPCYAIKTADSSVTFTIEKASATVTVEEKVGVDTAAKYIKFSVNGNGILGGDEIICTYKISRNGVLVATVDDEGNITLEEGQSLTPGEYDVTVEAENDNYSFAYNAGKLTVTAADDYYTLTIVGGDSRTFDGGVFKPEVKAVVTETKEEETLITLSYGVIRNVGIYEIKVKVGALEKEYTLQLRITAKEISLDWDVSGLVYDGTAKKPSATIKAGELADGDEVTVIVATAVEYVNAGEYTASASLGGKNAGNYVLSNSSAEFTVSPASVEITIEDATSVYGENAASLRLNSTSELYGKKLSEIVEIVCEVTSESNVGTYDISLIGKDENFTISFEKGHYFVTKRAITVTIDNKSSVYGEAFAALTANVTSGSIVNGDENVFVLVKENGTSAGEYAITTDSSLDNENYLITVTPGVYTIEKREITVKVNNSESVYGEEFAALTSEISAGSFAEGDDLSGVVKLAKAAGEIVGTYAITAENVNANYSVTFVYTAGDRSLYEITKREVVLTIKNNEFSYTDDISDMKLVIAVKDGYSLKDGETLEVLNLECTIKQNGIVLTSKTLRGGDWRYSASYSNDNYSITFENADDDTLDYGILTITKPVLELADLTAEHTYNGETFAYYDYETAVTFKANSTADDFGCELYFGGKKVDEMKNAGTYTVRVILKSSAAFALKDGVDGSNYKDYTVIVNKKDITEQIGFVCEDGVTTENGIYVPLGNYTQISSTLNGTAIGFTELLTFGGEESELSALGEYKYKVTVKDDNYSGEKEFTLIVVPSIEVKSANLKKYTAEYYEIRTSANADKVRNLFAKLTDSDRILFTNAKHAEIYSAAENVEGAHVDYLKETLKGKISAFEKEQSYASILEAREVALDLTAFKTGEGEEEIAAYEAAWNEYFETLTNDGASASGIADYMSLAAALVSASAALLAITKRIAL